MIQIFRLAMGMALLWASTALGQPSIAITRDLKIDGLANNLIAVGWLLPTRDGGIAFSQPRDGNFLLFDSLGKQVGQFGGTGQGPGEFTSLGAAGFVGDSIWIADALERRVTVVTPRMTLARTFSVAGVSPAPAQSRALPTTTSATPRALFGDGTLLVHASESAATVTPGFDTTGRPLFRVASDATIKAYVAHVPAGPPSSVSMSSGRGGRTMAIPFAARTLDEVSARGTMIAMLNVVYAGRAANTMRLVVLRSQGDTVYARNIPFTPDRIPQRVADSARTAMIERARRPAELDMAALVERAVQIPPVHAPFTYMILNDEGAVWIRLRRAPGETDNSWLVVDGRGNVTGTARTPSNVGLLALTSTHVWGTERDVDGVVSVVRYRISAR